MSASWMPEDYTEEDFITSDRIEKHVLHLNDAKYIKTDALVGKGACMWRFKVHRVQPATLWVSGHSDYEVSDAILQKWSGKFQVWYGENVTSSDPRVHNLPIGITNALGGSHPTFAIYGDLAQMVEALQVQRSFQNWAYWNVNTQTHPRRREIQNALLPAPWITEGSNQQTKQGRWEYLLHLRKHPFTICPRGNGIDTHRLWEALYMGSIPVVEQTPVYREFADLPILMVPDLTKLTQDTLQQAYGVMTNRTDWNFQKLKVHFWTSILK